MPPGLARPQGRGVDLHVHTYFSDGTLSPEAVVALAAERGLAALSITDHDSLESLEPALKATVSPLELVPGIELSTVYGELDLHILGYYIDPAHEPLGRRLDRFRDERRERAMTMLARLRDLGVELDSGEVIHLAGPGVIGRPHIARAMVRAGHVPSLDDAFRQYLGRGGRAFVPRVSFRAEEAIDLVLGAGGVSVLAHPWPVAARLDHRGARAHGASRHRGLASAAPRRDRAALSRARAAPRAARDGRLGLPRRATAAPISAACVSRSPPGTVCAKRPELPASVRLTHL
jgi:predicted metal-dependent phosphoesterase TrpH